jgi:hypothetical protein
MSNTWINKRVWKYNNNNNNNSIVYVMKTYALVEVSSTSLDLGTSKRRLMIKKSLSLFPRPVYHQ